MENKKLLLKAFVITVLIATRLLSPESAEATPVPPGLTALDLANAQNSMNLRLKSNRDRDPLQWAARIKNEMFRGEGVWVKAQLDIHLDERGRIIGKDTISEASGRRGEFVRQSSLSSTDFVRNPQIHRSRMIDIRSDDGEVWKADMGYRHNPHHGMGR